MSANITRSTGAEAYDLIYSEHLAKLPLGDQEVIRRAMANSMYVWIGRDDDVILGVWGVVPPTLLADLAYLWLYTTDALVAHQFMFIRRSQLAIEEMLQTFPTLYGHCAVDASKSIRWLRWLGAEFGPREGQLIPFQIRAKHG